MVFKVICTIVLVLLLESPSNGEVIQSHGGDLLTEIAGKELSVVLFFEPIPRIEQLQKMFRLAAEKFEGNDRVSFLQLDCKRYREDSKNLDLQKLPTVRVYRNGVKETDLKGDVSVSSMISFVERALTEESLVKKWDSMNKLEEYISSISHTYSPIISAKNNTRDIITVVLFNSKNGERARVLFSQVAAGLIGNFELHQIEDSDFSKFGINNVPTVAVYRRFGEPQFLQLQDHTEKSAIVDFIISTSANHIEEITKENIKQLILKKRLPLLILWLNYEDSSSFEFLTEQLRRAANYFKNELAFVYSDGPKNLAQVRQFGLKGTFPAVTILDTKENLHYPFEDRVFNNATFVQIANDFLNKKIQPNLRKQAPPASNSGPVKVLVYDDFQSSVVESTKDVVVFFYHSASPLCQTLEKELDKVAEKLNPKGFVFYKFDLKENDTPRHGINSVITKFPTIKYFPAHYKVPSPFRGDADTLNAEKLESWVERQHSENLNKKTTHNVPDHLREQLIEKGFLKDKENGKDEL